MEQHSPGQQCQRPQQQPASELSINPKPSNFPETGKKSEARYHQQQQTLRPLHILMVPACRSQLGGENRCLCTPRGDPARPASLTLGQNVPLWVKTEGFRPFREQGLLLRASKAVLKRREPCVKRGNIPAAPAACAKIKKKWKRREVPLPAHSLSSAPQINRELSKEKQNRSKATRKQAISAPRESQFARNWWELGTLHTSALPGAGPTRGSWDTARATGFGDSPLPWGAPQTSTCRALLTLYFPKNIEKI